MRRHFLGQDVGFIGLEGQRGDNTDEEESDYETVGLFRPGTNTHPEWSNRRSTGVNAPRMHWGHVNVNRCLWTWTSVSASELVNAASPDSAPQRWVRRDSANFWETSLQQTLNHSWLPVGSALNAAHYIVSFLLKSVILNTLFRLF